MFATSSRNRSALSSDPYVARHVNSRLLGCRTSVGRHPSHISRPITAERRSGSWCPVRWPMIGMRGVDIASVAKAYRLLKAIMNTAVDDGLIRRSPIRLHLARMWHAEARSMLRWPTRGLPTWVDGWWGYVDLNHGPLPYQGSALTG